MLSETWPAKCGIYTRFLKLKPVYDHEAFLHLEAAKKVVANQKSN
jgi:hypothetical protein